MAEKTREHLAYMLRIWSVRDDRKVLWRASLQNAQTSERRGFASLEDLFEYLRSQATAMAEAKAPGKKEND